MNPNPERIQDLFLKIVELPFGQRAAALDRECGNDLELRARIEALLKAHDEPDSSLILADAPLPGKAAAAPQPGSQDAAIPAIGPDESPPAASAAATADFPSNVRIGAEIAGRYRLEQKIGEGGMGEVWVTRQTSPVKRKVALKLIKAGMDSRAVLARFEQERQALAMMDHPNIARVLDAGMTATGQPFFVMELVNGLPLTRFCDEARLTPKRRLELFVPICQAIQHAHQKGIVHRDLKPANILVTLIDGEPVPKVIDFGVAKATGGRLTDETMSTAFGAAIGTLEYMSPEQAGYSNSDIDTRADIYSLGVILYELLTGLVPIDAARLRKAAMGEMLRIIQEEEPAKPSTRLSTDQSLPSLAALRQTDPHKLMTLLRGELDWVVMKCLEKSRERRYATADALSRDIRRYLADEPVEARPPSATYRIQKFVRRNRGRVIAASLVLLALVAGITGTTGGLITAKRALRGEASQRSIAERVANERERALATAEYERSQTERARAAADMALYFNRVNLAAQYWQSGDLAQSRRTLDLCTPQLRGWEWRYLDRLYSAASQTLPGNGQFTTELSVSKDGRRLAAFSPYGDGGARIWDLARGQPLTEVNATRTGRRFSSCTLSPDGRIIALGEQSGAIAFWDAEAGQLVREFVKLPRPVQSLSFSPDGKWLAAGRAERRNGEMLNPLLEPPRNEDLVVWDVASGVEVFHPRGFGFICAFSPDGGRLLTDKLNPAIRLTPQIPETLIALIDTSNWTEVNTANLGSADSFAFSASGKSLALGGYDRIKDLHFVRIVGAKTGDELTALSSRMTAVHDLALSPDGSTLAVTKGLSFGEVEIWDVKTRRHVRTLRGHTDTVNSVVFTPSGTLVSCSSDRTIKTWDPVIDPEVQWVVRPRVAGARPAVLICGGQLLAFSESNTVNLLRGGTEPAITLVECGTGRGNDRTLAGNSGGTVALACTDDGRRLASGARTGEVTTWDAVSLAELWVYHGHDGTVSALAISPDGRRVASACEPPQITRARRGEGRFPAGPVAVPVKVWDAESGREQLTLDGHFNGVYQLAFSADGRWLASSGVNGIRIWDATTGKLTRAFERSELQSGTADALAFSASGRSLATAGNHAVELWNVASGHSTAVFRAPPRGTLAISISPDESRLATAAGQEVKIWDAQSGLESISLPLPRVGPDQRAPDVVALAWSTDGQRLRAAQSDGSVVEWNGTAPSKPRSNDVEQTK